MIKGLGGGKGEKRWGYLKKGKKAEITTNRIRREGGRRVGGRT